MQDKRRKLLKALTLGSGTVTLSQLPSHWSKPVVDSVVLPAHAQTTGSGSTTDAGQPQCTTGTFIQVFSSAANNVNRRIMVLNSADTVVVGCGATPASDLNGQALGLPPGTYRIYSDAETALTHSMTVTTECGTVALSADVNASGPTPAYLMATLVLPSGAVTPVNGVLDGALGSSGVYTITGCF